MKSHKSKKLRNLANRIQNHKKVKMSPVVSSALTPKSSFRDKNKFSVLKLIKQRNTIKKALQSDTKRKWKWRNKV
jgi:hypothetical protein